MRRLQIFYRTWIKIIVLLMASLGVFIGKDVILFIESRFSDSLQMIFVKVVTSSLFFSVIFLFLEKIIRDFLWKYLNRDIDFSGEWIGRTYYTSQEIPADSDQSDSFTPFFLDHKVIIDQNCLNIKIQPSPGNNFINWSSIAIDITETKKLLFAYEVKYQGDNRFNTKAIGYEEMEVLRQKSRYNKLPILMSGIFYHCAMGQKPIYRGNTIFVRANYKTLIKQDDLPGFAKDIFEVITRTP